MIELDFKEPETFKTPDGEEYLVNPLLTEDMKLILKFVEMDKQQSRLRDEGKLEELNKLVYEDSVALANNIIDKSIVNKNSGELLQDKYRTPYLTLLQIVRIVINETVGTTNNEGSDTPLELQKKSSKASEETSTPSKKKGGRRKN